MLTAEPLLTTLKKPVEVITPHRSKMILSTREGFYFVEKTSIRFLEASGNYCYIHFNEQEKVLCSKPLKHFSDILRDSTFCKIHQSYLININAIRFLDPSVSKVSLLSGEILPVARSKKETLRLILKNLFD